MGDELDVMMRLRQQRRKSAVWLATGAVVIVVLFTLNKQAMASETEELPKPPIVTPIYVNGSPEPDALFVETEERRYVCSLTTPSEGPTSYTCSELTK